MSDSLPPPPVPPDADREKPDDTFVPFGDLVKKVRKTALRKYLAQTVTSESVKH